MTSGAGPAARRRAGRRLALRLGLGGVAVELRPSDARLAAAARRRYRLFLSSRRPALVVDVDVRAPGPGREPRPFLPTVRREGGVVRWSRGDGEGWFDERSRRGALSVWPSVYSLDAALRVLFAELLARRGGFFMHAAALSRGGAAMLCPGPSGAGKSTLVRTCRELEPLGDELVLVRRRGKGFEALSTPFWGDGKSAPSAGKGGVRALMFLGDRGPARSTAISRGEALRRAMRCLVWFSDSPALGSLWREVNGLVGSVPAYRLAFQKGVSPRPALEALS